MRCAARSQRCWNIPAGAADAENLQRLGQVQARPSGALEGSPEIIERRRHAPASNAPPPKPRAAPSSRCAPYNLPADKYDAWADVIVNFDPSEMF